jgi:hypothetical protein
MTEMIFARRWDTADTLWLTVILALGVAHGLNFTTAWDDAFISFRIAEHWAQTGEPAYNLGQVQPVATNFLWVALLALGNKLTGLNALRLAQGLGVAAGLGILGTLYVGVRALVSRSAAVLAAFFCLLSGAWAAWPLTGLETSWFTWLALSGILCACVYGRTKRIPWLGISALAWGGATLTRPEGALWFGLTLGVLTVFHWRAWKDLLVMAGIYALVLAPALVYHGLVFHVLLPNAFYAKVHGFSNWKLGWGYLKDFIKTYQLAYAVWFVLPVLASKTFKAELVYVGALLLGLVAWVVVIGGDFMPYHRFFSPLWPLLCIGLGVGIEQFEITLAQVKSFAPWMPKAVSWTASGMLGLMFLLPTYTGLQHKIVQSWTQEEHDRTLVGLWLAGTYLPTDTVVLKPAGIIPYYSGLPAYDVYSLVDRQAAQTAAWVPENWVGHQQVNMTRMLDLKPKLVILDEHLYAAGQLPDPNGGAGAVERAWRADARSRDFTPTRAEIEPSRWLQYFVRKEFK